MHSNRSPYQRRDRDWKEADMPLDTTPIPLKYNHEFYGPKTDHGKAVADSGFGRVCPRCGYQWSDRLQWEADTEQVDKVRSSVGPLVIRAHIDCGGQMAIGRQTT